MTVAALRSELPGVNVVADVATAAGRWHIGGARRVVAVAGVTDEILVGAVQRKCSMQVVIEIGDAPVIAVVAGSAVAAEGVFVGVVVRVTANAAAGCIMKTVARVAFTAGNGCVHAGQRETAKVVVKAGNIMPRCLRVTLAAIIVELSAM